MRVSERVGLIGPIAAGLLGVSVAACDALPGTPEGEARGSISQMLVDPGSAQFKFMATTPAAVCGTVNSKNRMGGYAGASLFIYDRKTQTATVFQDAPSLSDYRMISSGGEGDPHGVEYVQKLNEGCAFPRDWAAKCGTAATLPVPTNPALCEAWEKKDYGKLSDMARGY